MSKKDYELIAGVIERARLTFTGDQVVRHIAHDFARVLARSNEKFDTARFLAACGVA